jgi:hypothetical protein
MLSRKGFRQRSMRQLRLSYGQKGWRDWDQSGERIRLLRQSADFRIYTPASGAGIPVSILKSFAAPPAE